MCSLDFFVVVNHADHDNPFAGDFFFGKCPVRIHGVDARFVRDMEELGFTGLTPPVVHHVLLELDLASRIARHPGGRVSLVMG